MQLPQSVVCLFSFFAVLASADIDLSGAKYRSLMDKAGKLAGTNKPRSIAIVGGGIGGSSVAYMLRGLFGDDVTIDVYEPGDVCGRLATISVSGRSFESGGTVLHGKNQYAKEIASKFGLKEAEGPGLTLSFFDGAQYILRTSTWWLWTMIKLLLAFGIDLLRINWIETEFIDLFGRTYAMQDEGKSFSNLEKLMFAQGNQLFVNSTRITSCEFLHEKGVSNFTLNNLVSAAVRNIYGQTCTINGFAGLVTMAGIQSNTWSVRGGNKMMCHKLLEHSAISLIKEKVTTLTPTGENRFGVTTESGSIREYDIAIVAAPINRDKSHIDVSSVCSSKVSCPSYKDPRHYRKTVATFVKGTLNPKLFKCDSTTECPGAVFSTNGELFYRSIGYHVPVDFNSQKEDISVGVYKVFSDETLTTKQLDQLFQSRKEVVEKIWFAYPYYSPPDPLSSFELNGAGVYYTSAIEWAASAAEMSIVSAKNAALLAFNNWYKIDNNVNPKTNDEAAKIASRNYFV